jgi:thiol:disulfide interchange protein DsbC
MKNLNALEKEMIVYKAPQEKHVITVFTDITCGYCHKLHEEMKDYNALGSPCVIWPSRAGCRARPSRT